MEQTSPVINKQFKVSFSPSIVAQYESLGLKITFQEYVRSLVVNKLSEVRT